MTTQPTNETPLTYQASHSFTNRFGKTNEIIVIRSDRKVAFKELAIAFNKANLEK